MALPPSLIPSHCLRTPSCFGKSLTAVARNWRAESPLNETELKVLDICGVSVGQMAVPHLKALLLSAIPKVACPRQMLRCSVD